MPIERSPISISQFCELLAIDPRRFVGLAVDRRSSQITIELEPEGDMAQTSGTIPALTTGGKRICGKKGKR